jgi:nucleoside 2-deoxyribosyltransferase
MDIIKEILKLNLPLGEYAVFGSGPMAVHGIRKARDIDLIVTSDLYKKLAQSGWKEDGDNEHRHLEMGNVEAYSNWELDDYHPNIQKIINEAEIINGIALVRLTEVAKWKTTRGMEKDLRDVQLIQNYLLENRATKRILISSSMKFIDKFIQTKKYLEATGFDVETPEYLAKNLTKKEHIVDHLKKLKTCDILLLTNYIDDTGYGYVGVSGFFEAGWAFALDKKVYLLNKVNPESPYAEDLGAIINENLNGDLNQIKNTLEYQLSGGPLPDNWQVS